MKLRIKPEEKGTFGVVVDTAEATTQTCYYPASRRRGTNARKSPARKLVCPGVDIDPVKRVVDCNVMHATMKF